MTEREVKLPEHRVPALCDYFDSEGRRHRFAYTADQLRAAIRAERAESERLLRVAMEALKSTQQAFDKMIGRKPAFVEDSIAMANEALSAIRAHLEKT